MQHIKEVWGALALADSRMKPMKGEAELSQTLANVISIRLVT